MRTLTRVRRSIRRTNTPSSVLARPPYPRQRLGPSTRALGTQAVPAALLNAGLSAADIDRMRSYSNNDSTSAAMNASYLGVRLNFYADVYGRRAPMCLVGIAIGVIDAGLCKTVAIYRLINGFSQMRIGGSGTQQHTVFRDVGDGLSLPQWTLDETAVHWNPGAIRNSH
jgi:hypothetical protein